MKIAKCKGIEDVGIMEENMRKMGEEMANIMFNEESIMENLKKEIKKLKA